VTTKPDAADDAAAASPAASEAERVLAEHAAPVVRKVVALRLGRTVDAEDVTSQVLVDLILHAGSHPELLRMEPAPFASYVAAAAHHGCDRYVRRKYPLRWRLRNRVRYTIEHDRRFEMWKADRQWWCGLAGSRAAAHGSVPAADRLLAGNERKIGALLEGIFRLSGGPLLLTSIVDVAADLWQVPLVQRAGPEALEHAAHPGLPTDRLLDLRQRVDRTWSQIVELPVRQRQALLLNLRDEGLTLFIVTRTASLRAIAAALDMSVDTLADLWPCLPLTDNDIAARLGCTRQQVINLRMSARKRLANRLAGWGQYRRPPSLYTDGR
jgi:hypothetical protein